MRLRNQLIICLMPMLLSACADSIAPGVSAGINAEYRTDGCFYFKPFTISPREWTAYKTAPIAEHRGDVYLHNETGYDLCGKGWGK